MSSFDLVKPRGVPPRNPELLVERDVPPRLHDLRTGAPLYQVSKDLATSINVALSIGAPLLLTGDPGTGKTQLAYYLAWYFGIEADVPPPRRQQPFTLAVKSTTVARDLLYRFDTVAYFRDARVAKQGEGDDRIDKWKFLTKGPLWRAVEEIKATRPAVVLIDEIDKAPRDFPNDLLQELDQFRFYVDEVDHTEEVPADRPPPVVVITSNSEKPLPTAFLRRCVFHHIEFDEQLIRTAIASWRASQAQGPKGWEAAEAGASEVALPELSARDEAAMRAFLRVRDVGDLEKVPATAELLGWLSALDASGIQTSELSEGKRLEDLLLLSALLKDR